MYEPVTPEVDVNKLQQLVKLLFVLYEQQLPAGHVRQAIRIRDFVGWVNAAEAPGSQIQQHNQNFLNEGYHQLEIDTLASMLSNPWDAMALLHPLWRNLIADHPPLVHPIAFTHVAVTIGYRDQRVCQVACPTPFQPGELLGEGFLLALLQDQTRQILDTFTVHGFDKCYEQYAQPAAGAGQELTRRPVPPPAQGIGGI